MLARPGDEIAARSAAWGQLRASHADREQVIGALKAAYVAGMLDKDELDRRVGQALVPQTYAELADLTADLPAGLAAAEPKPSHAGGGQPLLRPGQIVAGSTMLYAGVWLYAPNPRTSALVVLGGFFYLCVLAIAMAVALENRLSKHSGSDLRDTHLAAVAGQHGARHQPPHGRQFLPLDSGQLHAAEALRRRPARPSLPRCAGRAPAGPSQPGRWCRRATAPRPRSAAPGPNGGLGAATQDGSTALKHDMLI